MKKNIFLVLTFSMLLLISACGKNYRIKPDHDQIVLNENEGFLGFMVESLDNLGNIQMKNVQNNDIFYVGSAKKGGSLILAKLIEGEYCLVGFDVYNLHINYEDQGFCTFVESGEINYFGEFIVRNPITTLTTRFKKFVIKLNTDFPTLCSQFIGESCQ
jgi:hypothetical protein